MTIWDVQLFYSLLGMRFHSDFGYFYYSRLQLLSMEAVEAQYIKVAIINSYLLMPI
jgi:hypothetical protein